MFSTLLLFAASSALAASGPAALNDHNVKDDIVELVRRGMSARDRLIEYTKKAQDEYNLGHSQEYLEYRLAAHYKTTIMNENLNQAISLTLDAYNIAPSAVGPIANGLMKGDVPRFRPRFFDGYTWSDVVRSPDGSFHYVAGDIDTGGNGEGATFLDGTVLVIPRAFEHVLLESPLGWPTPSSLAALLYHESVHFSELVSRGWDTREAIELRAYTQELKQADTFSLSENYRKFFKEMKDYYAKQIRAGNTHPMFETTENGAKQAYEFRSKQFWKEMEKELAAANAINVDWRKYLVASGDYPPEMGDTPDDDGDDEVTAETLNREAQRCGFVSRAPNLGDPWSTWGSLERSRWGTFGRGMGLFGLERKTTVDELRAMIFLARVCTDRSVRNAECGDRAGITAIEKGWSDPNFVKHAKGRQSDYPSEDYTIFSCVRRVAAAITVPVDLNRLQGVAKQYLRDEDAHWAAMFSGHDRQADRDARRTKGGSGDSSSGGGSSSIPDKDFSHARDAIRGYGGGVRF